MNSVASIASLSSTSSVTTLTCTKFAVPNEVVGATQETGCKYSEAVEEDLNVYSRIEAENIQLAQIVNSGRVDLEQRYDRDRNRRVEAKIMSWPRRISMLNPTAGRPDWICG
jgi:hypothetical protein